MSEPSSHKKLRYVPAPQVEQIALTEDQLRTLIRKMVREELASIKREEALQLPDWVQGKEQRV